MDKKLEQKQGTQCQHLPAAFKDVRKYHKIPAPNFCRSPVSCKVQRPSSPYDKISQTEAVIKKPMSKEHKVEQSSSSTSPLNVAVESGVTCVLAKSSQHIDQLEFNLSGLKVLISDLESTLTENVDKSSSQSESQQTQLSQNDLAGWFGDVCHSQRSKSLDSVQSGNEKTSQMERTTEAINPQEKQLVMSMRRETGRTRLTDAQNTRRPSSAKCILSATQRMLIPDVFRNCLPETTTLNYVSSTSDTSNHLVMPKTDSDVGHDSRSTSLNQSYDVEAPSELWLQRERKPQTCEKNERTPESGGEGQGIGSKVKRRLQMPEDVQEEGDQQGRVLSRPSSYTPKAAARWHEGLDRVAEKEEQLRQIHAAQIRVLQEEHRRQQEQLLQALAARYRVLHSVSLPHSMSTSRLGDTVTFPTLSQPSPSPLPEHYRHLLSAAAKGFLTRRLLKTERVAQLVRTVGDTLQFLKAFQQQSPNKALCSRQDLMLQERVSLQLRATRYEIYDIFFSLSAGERMQLISMDRDLARERELRRRNGVCSQPKGKSSLSAATQKSLERKRGLIIQKKTAERHWGAGARTRHKPGFSAEQPLEARAGQFRANPQRVPKSTYTSRPR
uniref:Centriolar coiled-coil protein of 110 kDa-like n=1 Tax=Neogobius melanostomus TaxID=47308 RepID=A0A8C6TY66_9GOBI